VSFLKRLPKLRNLFLVSLPTVVILVLLVELLLRSSPFLNSMTTDPASLRTPYAYDESARLFAPDMDTRVDYLTGTAKFTFQTNSFGLRSRSIAPQKPDDSLRILCVGDSFTEGFGVNQDETYPNQLDHILSGLGVEAEVLCAAMAGLHIWHYVDLLHYYGDLLKPDVVILGIYSGNDIEIAMLNEPGRMDNETLYGFLIPKSAARLFRSSLEIGTVSFTEGWSWLSGLDRWLWKTSRSYRLVSNGLFQTRPTVFFLSKLGMLHVGKRIEPTRLPVLNVDTDLYLAESDMSDDLNLLYGSAEMAFGDMVNFATENDISLLILNIPEGWQNPVWSFQTPRFTRLHDMSRVHNFWLRMNKKYNIPFRDLQALYKTAWEHEAYSVFDLSAPHGHFSKTDNSLVAFVLLDVLLENGHLEVEGSELENFVEREFPNLVLPFVWSRNSGEDSGN
jgi:hypothetical protein